MAESRKEQFRQRRTLLPLFRSWYGRERGTLELSAHSAGPVSAAEVMKELCENLIDRDVALYITLETRWKEIIPGKLAKENGSEAAYAIMTTDTRKKEFAVTFTLGGKSCVMGGIAKGSGMIAPNMATMLCFITTDAAIRADLLHQALLEVVGDTFNMMTVDGDTSTNDMVTVLANGAAGNPEIAEADADYAVFAEALVLPEKCTAAAHESYLPPVQESAHSALRAGEMS